MYCNLVTRVIHPKNVGGLWPVPHLYKILLDVTIRMIRVSWGWEVSWIGKTTTPAWPSEGDHTHHRRGTAFAHHQMGTTLRDCTRHQMGTTPRTTPTSRGTRQLALLVPASRGVWYFFTSLTVTKRINLILSVTPQTKLECKSRLKKKSGSRLSNQQHLSSLVRPLEEQKLLRAR